MNNKNIGFYCGRCFYNHNWDENTLKNTGLGGTETWVVEVCKRLSKGYTVIIFNDCEQIHTCSSGILYIPYKLFKSIINVYDFEHFFLMECIKDNIDLINSKNIYYMPSCEEITYGVNKSVLRLHKIKSIGYLSEWQKTSLIKAYDVTEDKLFKHCYGINTETYEHVNFIEKENSMVWSSQEVRGLNFFIYYIMPFIVKEIPDFKLYVSSYLNNSRSLNLKNVIFVGKKSKEELAELQKRCKIWIYPNIGLNEDKLFFHETFCITAVENAMAQNAIVCLGNKDGIETTLHTYSGLINADYFNEYAILYKEDFEKLVTDIVNASVKILKDDSYRISLVKELQDICKVYTWDNSYNELLMEMKRNEQK